MVSDIHDKPLTTPPQHKYDVCDSLGASALIAKSYITALCQIYSHRGYHCAFNCADFVSFPFPILSDLCVSSLKLPSTLWHAPFRGGVGNMHSLGHQPELLSLNYFNFYF